MSGGTMTIYAVVEWGNFLDYFAFTSRININPFVLLLYKNCDRQLNWGIVVYHIMDDAILIIDSERFSGTQLGTNYIDVGLIQVGIELNPWKVTCCWYQSMVNRMWSQKPISTWK